MIWTPWLTWDAVNDCPGPLHTRRDLPGGGKEVTWPPGTHPAELVYFTGDHTPPAEGSAIVLTEGEKAADAVAAVGFVAAGTVCGASATPSAAALALLSRYRLALSWDHDEPGWHHMGRIAAALWPSVNGPAPFPRPRLYIIDPPWYAPKGWDLADADPRLRKFLIQTARPMGYYLEPLDA